MLIPYQELVAKYPQILSHTDDVIHVGAHEREEAEFYRKYKWPVLWIDANKELVDKINADPYIRDDGKIPEYAVHAAVWFYTDAPLMLNVASNLQSSSLLELGTHAQSYPDITYVEKRKVPVYSLDDLASAYVFNLRSVFINLDIQGAEWQALVGGHQTLKRTNFIYTEVNTQEVYAGCKQLSDIDTLLATEGFKRLELRMTGAGWGDAFYGREELCQGS